jgi:hypothetical protein
MAKFTVYSCQGPALPQLKPRIFPTTYGIRFISRSICASVILSLPP